MKAKEKHLQVHQMTIAQFEAQFLNEDACRIYVNEFEFRYNNRKNADIFGAAIRAC